MKRKKILFLVAMLLSACSTANNSTNMVDKISSNSINVNSVVSSDINKDESESVTVTTSSGDKISNSITSSITSSFNSSSVFPIITEKLNTPINVNIDEQYYLNWEAVDYANLYLVYVNDVDVKVSENKLDIFDLLISGVRNTLSIQALDTTGKYLKSDICLFTYDDGGPYEGISIIEEDSYVENLQIKEENNQKIIEIPYDEISKDETGAKPDITLTFDYDSTNFKFFYESNDSILFITKQNGQPNTVEISFKDVGEITLNVVEFGNSNGYIFDSITIRVVRNETNGFSKFSIAYYAFNEVDSSISIIEAESYTMGSTPMDYVWLTVVVGEKDEINDPMNTVTWKVISGDALDFSYSYGLDVYYVGNNTVGTVVVQAISCYGDIDTITINVMVNIIE